MVGVGGTHVSSAERAHLPGLTEGCRREQAQGRHGSRTLDLGLLAPDPGNAALTVARHRPWVQGVVCTDSFSAHAGRWLLTTAPGRPAPSAGRGRPNCELSGRSRGSGTRALVLSLGHGALENLGQHISPRREQVVIKYSFRVRRSHGAGRGRDRAGGQTVGTQPLQTHSPLGGLLPGRGQPPTRGTRLFFRLTLPLSHPVTHLCSDWSTHSGVSQ